LIPVIDAHSSRCFQKCFDEVEHLTWGFVPGIGFPISDKFPGWSAHAARILCFSAVNGDVHLKAQTMRTDEGSTPLSLIR
jgi:hypothetical protein